MFIGLLAAILKNVMIIKFLLFLLSIFTCYSQEVKTNLSQIDIEYDINKIEVYYSASYKFIDATFDSELNFVPKIDNKSYYEGNVLNGRVKRVKKYTKNSQNNIKIYEGSTLFDKDGYVIESELENGKAVFFYDERKNLIREVIIRNSDTTEIKKNQYNEKNQLIYLNKQKYGNKNDPYNLSLTIEYNKQGNPVLIKNTHPIEKYTYVKKISYDGNIVTETEFSNDKIVDERKYWYSESNNVLKYEHNKSYTTFSEYNQKNKITRETTFMDNEFASINTYLFDENGNIIRNISSNNPKVHENINDYEFKYDSLKNIIYEKRTEAISKKEWETFYEYEYF
jgi:hypothetical protein